MMLKKKKKKNLKYKKTVNKYLWKEKKSIYNLIISLNFIG